MVILRVVSPPEPGAESEVRQLDVSGGVDENVVRLDVAMDEAHAVHTLDRARQLGYVKPDPRG